MDHIQGDFIVRVELPFLSVLDGSCRADEYFAEMILIYGKGDAISVRGITEELSVKIADFLGRNKINGNFGVGRTLMR